MRIDMNEVSPALPLRQYTTGTNQTDSFEARLELACKTQEDKELREACQEFESIFLYQMIRAMRATIPRSDFFGSSYGRDVFESMLDEQYAQEMSQTESIGLGELIYQQLSAK